MTNRFAGPAVLLLFLLVPVVCQADIAYSNFGTNDSFYLLGGPSVGHSSLSPNVHLANRFTSQASGELQSVEVAALRTTFGPGTDLMELHLWTNIGILPGQLLWSGTVDPLTASTASIYSTTAGFQAPTLTAGTDYWLSARALNGVDAYSWSFTSPVVGMTSTLDLGAGTSWGPPQITHAPAFRVSVASVPEPGSVVVLGCIGSLAVLRRRRR